MIRIETSIQSPKDCTEYLNVKEDKFQRQSQGNKFTPGLYFLYIHEGSVTIIFIEFKKTYTLPHTHTMC